ncbi:MAG TPA: iron chelate uptake ABC transporter family permease subunit [Candidatus Manganitrophaceae bacterium]|nr:iron chelate uptake ABC transporter family permease subunit [Candidatus Manganitrophaceae bacterium]
MIENFLSSWPLFHNTYLAGWLIALLLSIVGVLVVARDQIFIGAAISQASTFGIALAMSAGAGAAATGFSWLHSDEFLSAMAVAFSILAALITARGGETGGESHEAITGWIFLLSASLAVLVVSHSPHGLEEIHRLLSSSIIGATETDAAIFGTFAAATAALVLRLRRPLLLFALDPAMAQSAGMNLPLWSGITAAWLGLAIGLSIRSSGMIYTFGCLVLPALVAKNLCREVGPIFWVSPIVAVAAGVAGFMIANDYDYPPGQMTVALLSLLLVGAWGVRRLRRGKGTL